MLLIAENIPTTSENVPLIGVYLTIVMSLTSLSIILTVFVLQLHHANQFAPRLSRRTYFLLTRRLACILGMKALVARFEKDQKESLTTCKLDEEAADFTSLKSNSLINNYDCYRIRHDKSYSTPLNNGTIINHDQNYKLIKIRLKKQKACDKTKKSDNHVMNKQEEFLEHDDDYEPALDDFDHHCKRDDCDFLETIRLLNKNMRLNLMKQEKDVELNHLKNEWKLIALIVDRFLFWIFCILTVASTFILLFVVPILKNANLLSSYQTD
jgi:nicotinic acetylcholine receptor